MRSKKEQERHDQITRAAIETLAEHGISGTTLERIAANAGMARGHVRYFLGNREQVLVAAAVAFYEDPYVLPPEIDHVDAAISHLFGDDFAVPDQDNRVVRAFVELASTSTQIAAVLSEAYEASRRKLKELLAAEHPGVRDDDVDNVAQGVISMALGNAFLSDFDLDPARNERAHAVALRFIGTL